MGHPQWWLEMTPEQRLIHYKRNAPCTCPVNEQDWPKDLFEAYSYDPYLNTRHGIAHSIEKSRAGTCECNQCVNRIGILLGSKSRRLDVEAVREKIGLKLADENSGKPKLEIIDDTEQSGG